MGTDYKLSWREGQKRWRKRYAGKDYYFPAPEGKVLSYQRCYREWLKKKAEIDQERYEEDPDARAWKAAIRKVTTRLLELSSEDTPENREAWSFWFSQRRMYHQMLDLGVGFYGKGEAEVSAEQVPLVMVFGNDPGPPPWEQLEEELDLESSEKKTVAGNVQRFLRESKARVDRGDMSHGRYDSLRCCLEHFVKWKAVGEKPIESIDGPLLIDYRDHLQDGADKGKLSPHYAKTQLQTVKQFIAWCWEQDLLEMPRILQSKTRRLGISTGDKDIGVFTLDEITALLTAATPKPPKPKPPEPEKKKTRKSGKRKQPKPAEPRNLGTLKLYLLLMLNTGMQQQDIAELRHDEVDWEKGRITRKRGKTAKHESVPTVSYPLWGETFRLLKEQRSKHPTLALTNRDGGALKSEEIVGGKVKKSDNIRSAYSRLLLKLAKQKPPIKIDKPLKLLRKTAASKLGEHPEFGRFAQHFLGHSPRTIADKHYVRPSEEQFDRAVRWLGEQFGF